MEETIKKGSKGYAVKTLQYYLNLTEDGIFGTITEEAVKEFQKANNLKADGIVGSSTWSLLKKSIPASRRINKIIVHCTATPEGKDYTVDTIRSWHKAQGWSDIGYHYVIYRDGSIHTGRNESKIGAHCEGQNTYSIGICYVGGVASDGRTAKDTRTPKQKESLVYMLKKLMSRYHLTKDNIYCHNDFAAKACPSFSRKELIENL